MAPEFVQTSVIMAAIPLWNRVGCLESSANGCLGSAMYDWEASKSGADRYEFENIKVEAIMKGLDGIHASMGRPSNRECLKLTSRGQPCPNPRIRV